MYAWLQWVAPTSSGSLENQYGISLGTRFISNQLVDYSGASGWGTKANQCHFFRCLFLKTDAYSNFASVIKNNTPFPPKPLENNLPIWYPHLQVLQYAFLTHKDILHNYNPTIKFKTLILGHCYPLILRPHVSFSSCLNNVSGDKRILFRIVCWIQGSYLISFLQAGMFPPSFLDFSDLERPVIIGCLPLRFSWVLFGS